MDLEDIIKEKEENKTISPIFIPIKLYESWNRIENFSQPIYDGYSSSFKIESKVEPSNPIFSHKTNKIRRINGNNKETIISYEINGNELEIKTNGHIIGLRSLVRIILHETELYKEKYNRISPYKTTHEYDRNDAKHKYGISFIDVKDGFNNKHINIIESNRSNCIEQGIYKMFKYDFTELAVELGILKRVYNGYELVKKLNNYMNNCTYIKSKPSINDLKSLGFIVPDKYKNIKEV